MKTQVYPMYSFRNDYSESGHPQILQALLDNSTLQEEGYGEDRHTRKAIELVREKIGDSQAEVHLLSGGTQTNLIAISSFLRPHEACITPKSGHIATHETGAIEATGHKLLTVQSKDGKLTPELIKPILVEHHFEHMVKPRLVYISNPTELGTVYSYNELQEIYGFCKENDLLLYLDGARLGSAIAVKSCNLSLPDVYQLTDAFFIGGTKNGALLGEALVVRNPLLQKDLRYLIKQRGGLLAKGRVLGIQFEELFTETLYFDLARRANETAQHLASELAEKGCEFLIDSPTNQIFPIMQNEIIEQLAKKFLFYTWAMIDDRLSAIRLVTSWATPKEAVNNFIEEYSKLTQKINTTSTD